MQVLRVLPKELSKECVWVLNCCHDTQLPDFIVLYRKDTLYVNRDKLTKTEIKNIVNCIEYNGYDLCDDDTKRGKFLNNFYKKYGWNAYNVIHEAHSKVMDEKRRAWADERAKKLLPLMQDILECEDDSGCWHNYDEYLAYYIKHHADKQGHRSSHNLLNYGDEFIFYLGYFYGLGLLDIDD